MRLLLENLVIWYSNRKIYKNVNISKCLPKTKKNSTSILIIQSVFHCLFHHRNHTEIMKLSNYKIIHIQFEFRRENVMKMMRRSSEKKWSKSYFSVFRLYPIPHFIYNHSKFILNVFHRMPVIFNLRKVLLKQSHQISNNEQPTYLHWKQRERVANSQISYSNPLELRNELMN